MKYFLFIILLLSLQGCFTGIESTPRITDSDVKKQHIVVPPEHSFLSEVIPETITDWKPGKRLFITDSRISLVLSSDTPVDGDALVGNCLVFKGIRQLKSVMGDDMAIIDFVVDGSSQSVSYKTDVPYSEISSRKYFEVPFTIDCDMVEAVKSKLQGQRYFITTSLWYSPDGQPAVTGLRHVDVMVDDVQPGNSLYPLRVVFHRPDDDRRYAVFMTVGSRRTATRNFDTLFSFDDPRKRYPHITDDDWQLITHSKIKLGMTRDECRLALGAPATVGQRPTTAGMVEYWSFADGVYLVFEDGYLVSYRR